MFNMAPHDEALLEISLRENIGFFEYIPGKENNPPSLYIFLRRASSSPKNAGSFFRDPACA